MYSPSLSPIQEEALMNFQAITDNYDQNIAINFLSRHNWDVSAASNTYFASQYQPPPSQPERLVDPEPDFYSPPPQRSSKSFFSKILNAFTVSEPRENPCASRFIQRLASATKSNSNVPFSKKYLQEVLSESQKRKKPLLMFVCGVDTPNEFLRDVLCNSLIKGIISDSFIAWGVEMNSSDGRTANVVLSIQNYPCFAVVKVDDSAKPLILDKVEGLITVERLAEFLESNAVAFTDMMYPHLKEERLIREQQERELKEAEAIVREREKAEREKQAKIKQEIEEQKRILEEKEKIKQEKKRKVKEEPPEGPEIAHLSLRMPSGQKIERRFMKDDIIENVYDFIETLDIQNKFQIVSGFPPKVLDDKGKSLEAEGLFPKAVVHVREINS